MSSDSENSSSDSGISTPPLHPRTQKNKKKLSRSVNPIPPLKPLLPHTPISLPELSVDFSVIPPPVEFRDPLVEQKCTESLDLNLEWNWRTRNVELGTCIYVFRMESFQFFVLQKNKELMEELLGVSRVNKDSKGVPNSHFQGEFDPLYL